MLSKRLSLICQMAGSGDTVADIGTDHAYVPIFLVKSKRFQNAICTDIKIGPVQIANNNILKYGLKQSITTKIGDGLSPIINEPCDTVIIAGMGGKLIAQIISENLATVKDKNLVLQPMNAHFFLREYLIKNGFKILDEALTKEQNKLYLALKVVSGKEKYNELALFIGKKLKQNHDPLYRTYIDQTILRLNSRLLGLEKSKQESSFELKALIKVKKALIKERDELIDG